ncbi:hypothetical protein Tco_0636078 [Tanacetum coccineum]
MSSDSASSEVTYTSISSHGDPLAWVVDFFRLHEPDSPEATPASPDYVPSPEEPEQAPLSPDYVSGPDYCHTLKIERKQNSNIGVRLQGTKYKSQKTTLKWTF